MSMVLSKRGLDFPDEHVVLADCRNGKVLSSQIAYFRTAVATTPEDVAVVSTPDSQSRLWPNAVTSGFFTTTNITFTANLGSASEDGSMAGTGDNGYVNFTCWVKHQAQLYRYGDVQCSMVYDCNHQPASASAANSTNNNSLNSPPQEGGVSTTVTVAIAASSAGGFLVLASVIGAVWCCRAKRKGRDACGFITNKRRRVRRSGSLEKFSIKGPIYEMEAPWSPSDLVARSPVGSSIDSPAGELGGVAKVEIDGTERIELDVKERQYLEEKMVKRSELDNRYGICPDEDRDDDDDDEDLRTPPPPFEEDPNWPQRPEKAWTPTSPRAPDIFRSSSIQRTPKMLIAKVMPVVTRPTIVKKPRKQ
jgi:hypothetical protein